MTTRAFSIRLSGRSFGVPAPAAAAARGSLAAIGITVNGTPAPRPYEPACFCDQLPSSSSLPVLAGRSHGQSGRIPKIGLSKIDHLIERMRVRRVPASALGVCAIAAFSSGCKSHPANAPAGTNRLLFPACPLRSAPHPRRLQNRARDGWRSAMRPRRETTRSPPRHAPPTRKPDGRSIIGMSNFVQTLDAGGSKIGLNRRGSFSP
jgi:hypothetical protein